MYYVASLSYCVLYYLLPVKIVLCSLTTNFNEASLSSSEHPFKFPRNLNVALLAEMQILYHVFLITVLLLQDELAVHKKKVAEVESWISQTKFSVRGCCIIVIFLIMTIKCSKM